MGLNFSKLGITTLDQKFSFGIGAIFGGTVMNVLRGIPRLGNDSNPDASDLCGTYRLESSDAAESGQLVYEADGTISSHVVRRSAATPEYTGLRGKWWVHNARTAYAATYPPHDGTLVEHEITAASDPSLVGKNHVQRYQLSPDGQQLTCSVVELQSGGSHATSTMQWRRVSR